MNRIGGALGPATWHLFAGLGLVAVAPLMTACQQTGHREPDESAASGTVIAPDTGRIAPASALSPVGRAELLAAAAAAADQTAAGNALPRSSLELKDRSFELRLPFACGDTGLGNWGQWSTDPRTGVLRVTIRPQLWGEDPTFRLLAAGAPHDAAEGFWIERPWTSSEQCPAEAAPVATPTAGLAGRKQGDRDQGDRDQGDRDQGDGNKAGALPAHTLALVQYFSPDAPRTLRRGNRPYTFTAKLPPGRETGPQGFRVRLVGRISGFPDGQPIHCAALTPAQPPICAAAVEFTKVVLENAVTGESLTEWGR